MIGAVVDAGKLLEVGLAAGFKCGIADVAEIVFVADFGVVNSAAPALANATAMIDTGSPAILALQRFHLGDGVNFNITAVVITEPGSTESGFCHPREVAQFQLQHLAAFLYVARGNGGVVIGGQVEINGLRVIQAIFIAKADLWVQQSAGATIIDRIAYPGQVNDGYVFDFNTHMLGGGDACLRVDSNVAGGHRPGVIARLAGGIGGIVDKNHAVFLARHGARCATYSCFMENPGGVVDSEFAGVEIEMGFLAKHQQARLA